MTLLHVVIETLRYAMLILKVGYRKKLLNRNDILSLAEISVKCLSVKFVSQLS